jgi:uncharacterized Zn-finger protein
MGEIIEVSEKIVKCDGDPLSKEKPPSSHGHPVVYLKIDCNSKVQCPYCGRVFVYKT